jgi:hypothetical protein
MSGKEIPGGADARYSGNSWFPDIPRILPHEKVFWNFGGLLRGYAELMSLPPQVFPIQIGSELFRLR